MKINSYPHEYWEIYIQNYHENIGASNWGI